MDPVRTQKTYNIDMRLETCTRIRTFTYGYKLSGF